eukprot:912327-Amphidinium_carterae.1
MALCIQEVQERRRPKCSRTSDYLSTFFRRSASKMALGLTCKAQDTRPGRTWRSWCLHVSTERIAQCFFRKESYITR